MKNIDKLRRNLPRSTYGNSHLENPNYNGTYDVDFDKALENAWKLLDAMESMHDTSSSKLYTMLQALALTDTDNAATYGMIMRKLTA